MKRRRHDQNFCLREDVILQNFWAVCLSATETLFHDHNHCMHFSFAEWWAMMCCLKLGKWYSLWALAGNKKRERQTLRCVLSLA